MLKSGSLASTSKNVSSVANTGGVSQVKSILWKFNHKFGFIAAEITKTDNTVVKVYQNDTNVATM
jgi:molecular chaperone GrpE (heat shock protein)